MTSSHKPANGMATRQDLELLHTLTCRSLIENLQGTRKPSVELLQVALRFVAAQPCMQYRVADATERALVAQLLDLYIKGVVAGASVPEPKATMLVEIRRLMDFLRETTPVQVSHGDLVGAELPFETSSGPETLPFACVPVR